MSVNDYEYPISNCFHIELWLALALIKFNPKLNKFKKLVLACEIVNVLPCWVGEGGKVTKEIFMNWFYLQVR